MTEYYRKKRIRVQDTKEGDWVFDPDAHLCYVTKHISQFDGKEHTSLHYYALEECLCNDSIVYPLSLTTIEIMKRMEAVRDRYHAANIMNADFSRELEDALDELMKIDDEDEGAADHYDAIWRQLKVQFEERLEHAKALHIRPKRSINEW